MTFTDEQIEKAAKAIRPWAFRELSYSERMSDDYAVTRQRHAQEQARDLARAALEAVAPGPGEVEPVADDEAITEVALAIKGSGLSVTDEYDCASTAVARLRELGWGPLDAPPSPEPGELERLREAHRENIRLLGHVAHDLTGRVEGGKVAAIYTAINNARAALAEGGRDE